MNFTHSQLSDSELFKNTAHAAQNEKEAMLALIDYLVEVDRRKLYAAHDYSSLFDYLVRGLKYSESQATERMNAVRLILDLPEAKAHLESGKLNITSAAQVQRFFRLEAKAARYDGVKISDRLDRKRRIQILKGALGQPKRAVEKFLLSEMSESAKIQSQERARLISPERTELRFSFDEAAMERLGQVKQFLGDVSLESVFQQALDALYEKELKKRGAESLIRSSENPISKKLLNKNKDLSTPPAELRKENHQIAALKTESRGLMKNLENEFNEDGNSKVLVSTRSRYIPMSFRRELFKRSKGQCEYKDPQTQKRCPSQYRLQIDHIRPLARGGRTESQNLRHLCPEHNTRSAKEWNLIP